MNLGSRRVGPFTSEFLLLACHGEGGVVLGGLDGADYVVDGGDGGSDGDSGGDGDNGGKECHGIDGGDKERDGRRKKTKEVINGSKLVENGARVM